MFLQPFRGKTVSGHSSHHAGRSTRSVSGPLDNQHSRANVFDVSYSHIDAELAIVSLKVFQDLQQSKQPNSLQALRRIAQWAKDHHINTPADLSKNHNK